MASYPGDPVDQIDPQNPPALDYLMPPIPNVRQAFRDIPFEGVYLRIQPEGTFDGTTAYKEFTFEKIEEKKRKTHFQGIARTKDGKFIIISGGDNVRRCAQLFIIEVRAYLEHIAAVKKVRKAKDALGSNVFYSMTPPVIDRLAKVVKIKSGQYWHAGGIDILGNVLVVPLEAQSSSQVRFYDISDPLNPVDLGDDVAIVDDNVKAGAASMVRLKNGRFIVAVWTDSNAFDGKKGRFTFYYSPTSNLLDGFKTNGSYDKQMWPFDALGRTHEALPRFQSIHMVLQPNDRLFVICTDNMAKLSPIVNRKNRAFLLSIRFVGQSLGNPNFRLTSAELKMELEKEYPKGKIFDFGGTQYNFDAGCGLYHTADGRLALYSTHHWRRNGFINFVEYYPHKDNTPINDMDDAVIEFYEDKNFEGRAMRIYGKRNALIRNYKDIFVQNDHFNDKEESVRFKLPPSKFYVVYEDRLFNDGDEKKNRLTLKGNGQWREVKDLGRLTAADKQKVTVKDSDSFKRKGSSSRYKQ